MNLYSYRIYSLLEKQISPHNIDDMNTYLVGMQKSLQDKLFFINKISPDTIVDFGCADGALLKELIRIKPNLSLIGYDIDDEMLEEARKNIGNSKIILTDDWQKIERLINNYNKPSILLSSVIHEVYSYTNTHNINYFWNQQVFNDKFKYVIIRDMMPSASYEKFNIVDIKKIRQNSNQQNLKEFEEKWGSINENFRTLLHWILKYRYTENWKRELKEDYVPITLETLERKIPKGWSVIYKEHYTLPFIKEIVKKDFGVELHENTHIKMIIERKS